MLAALAAYAVELGRAEDAETWAREALDLAARMRDQVTIVWGIATLAWSSAARREARRAGILWGAVEAEEARTPIGGWEEGERERYEAAVTEVAGPEFEEGRQKDRRLPLDEAVSYVQSTPPLR